MNTFTASNGIHVVLTNAGATGYTPNHDQTESTSYLGFEEMVAWREFFRAEEDERLGRWRYDEDITVRVTGAFIRVENHRDATYSLYWADGRKYSIGEYGLGAAAAAFFDAHPEPKPWHDAKPGEVWVITTRNVGDEVAVRVALVNEVVIFEYVTSPTTHLSIKADRIESGRRIWPEEVA